MNMRRRRDGLRKEVTDLAQRHAVLSRRRALRAARVAMGIRRVRGQGLLAPQAMDPRSLVVADVDFRDRDLRIRSDVESLPPRTVCRPAASAAADTARGHRALDAAVWYAADHLAVREWWDGRGRARGCGAGHRGMAPQAL